MEKRRLGFWEIWNLSFGFLGIQMGFALQNANASRILQIFGADVQSLSWFWIIPPLVGLVVQPLIGHYSDTTWTKFGRRKPYFFTGAILASIGLVLMPQAGIFTAFLPALWIGAGFLMIMDASINVAMEPFRALVADILPADQRTLGYSVQTALIGIGAVIGSWLPYAPSNWFNITTHSAPGKVPFYLILSFILGAACLIGSVMVTVLTTKEYSPKELAKFDKDLTDTLPKTSGITSIFSDLMHMPATMKQLAWVQFFSWFGFFGLWVFCTPAIAHHFYGTPLTELDNFTKSQRLAYREAADWVGIIFGVYNGVSAIFAFCLPYIAHKISRKTTHAISLFIGGLGLISMYFFSTPNMLIISMIGVGIAWASVLAMPYAILAGALPAKKMGVYMGIFNFFIVIPQIINALIGGPIVKHLYGGNSIYAIITSGIALIIAGICAFKIYDIDDNAQLKKL